MDNVQQRCERFVAASRPQLTKAVLGILVCDALDQPRQHLSIRWIGLCLHDARRLALNYATRLAHTA